MSDRSIRKPTLEEGRVSQEGLNINRNPDGRIRPPRAPSSPPNPGRNWNDESDSERRRDRYSD